MIGTSDFNRGAKIIIDGEPYSITEFQHVKPGKGNQFTRTKLKNLISGSNLDRTIKSGEKFEVPDVEYKDMSFLYEDGDGFHFMDQSSFEQITLNNDLVGDSKNYLIEEMICNIVFFNERAIGIDLPNTVVLKVEKTDPNFKGNTVTNTTKPATLETGAVVQVPMHINEGDRLKIDTKDGNYMERVNS